MVQKYFFVLHLKRESKTITIDVNIFTAEVCQTKQGAAKPAPGNAVGWSWSFFIGDTRGLTTNLLNSRWCNHTIEQER